MRVPIWLLWMVIVLASLPAQALAHAKLLSALPAVGSTATPTPTELRLNFSEAIESKFAKVTITDADHKAVQTGQPKLEGNTLVVPLAGPIPGGSYTVEWQVVAKDGHKTKGTYSFEAKQ